MEDQATQEIDRLSLTQRQLDLNKRSIDELERRVNRLSEIAESHGTKLGERLMSLEKQIGEQIRAESIVNAEQGTSLSRLQDEVRRINQQQSSFAGFCDDTNERDASMRVELAQLAERVKYLDEAMVRLSEVEAIAAELKQAQGTGQRVLSWLEDIYRERPLLLGLFALTILSVTIFGIIRAI